MSPAFDPTILNDALASSRTTIFSILSESGSPFIQLGLNIFKGLSIIMIVIAGAKIMFRADESFHKLAHLIAIIMCVWAMVTLYTTPSRLTGGYSFSEVIPRGAFSLADTVGAETKNAMLAKLQQINDGVAQDNSFSMLHFKDTLIYIITTFLIAVLELAMFIVIAFGYLALAACLVMGPILIPFLLIPKLDFLFWSWLKATIKYSFYPVIGNIVIMAICKLMLSLMSTQQLSTGVEIAQIPLLIIIFVAGIYAILKTPSLVNDIFQGASSAGSALSGALAAKIL